jgi:hypothetical protein
VAVEVTAADHVDMDLELLDVDAMDTGRYRALVVQDPSDPRGLRGFVRLAAVGIRSALDAAESSEKCLALLSSLENGSFSVFDWRHSADVRALDQLASELEAQTQLRATVAQDAWLHEDGWLDSPFVLLTSAVDFEPTAEEVERLGQYLVSGGFAYVESIGPGSAGDDIYGRVEDLASLRDLVSRALERRGLQQGKDWHIEQLAMDHPVFSSYHKIPTLPRSYWSVVYEGIVLYVDEFRQHPERFQYADQRGPYLEGVFANGRLVAIYSQQRYRDFWSRGFERYQAQKGNLFGNRTSSAPAFRLGINIVVYALTHEGSLARKLVAQ